MSVLGTSSLLSSAQPTFGVKLTELRLRAMINLGVLFNASTLLTDSQIADNPHFFRSFLTKGENPSGAFGVLAAYIRAGCLKVLLRDEFYIQPTDRVVVCNSISDVYDGWLQQELPGAWVIQDRSSNRTAYIETLDTLLAPQNIIRYPYRTVKSLFADRLRAELAAPQSPLATLVNALPDGLRKEYLAIADRPYFSHSDLYDFVTRHGYINSSLAIFQGFLDEASYAETTAAGLFGPDTPSHSLVSSIWRPESSSAAGDSDKEFADRIWQVPSIRLLGLLSPAEVLTLREKAGPLFEIQEVGVDAPESEIDHLRDTYLDRLEVYWYAICDTLANKHSEAVTTPVRTIVSAGHRWRGAPLWLRRLPSLVLDIPVRLLPWKGAREAFDAARAKLNLRVILAGENSELTNLRRLVPRHSWIAAPSLIGSMKRRLEARNQQRQGGGGPGAGARHSNARQNSRAIPVLLWPEAGCA